MSDVVYNSRARALSDFRNCVSGAFVTFHAMKSKERKTTKRIQDNCVKVKNCGRIYWAGRPTPTNLAKSFIQITVPLFKEVQGIACNARGRFVNRDFLGRADPTLQFCCSCCRFYGYLTTLVYRTPQGTTITVLPATNCYSCCRINYCRGNNLFPKITPLATMAGAKLITFGCINLLITDYKRSGKHMLCINIYLCSKR